MKNNKIKLAGHVWRRSKGILGVTQEYWNPTQSGPNDCQADKRNILGRYSEHRRNINEQGGMEDCYIAAMDLNGLFSMSEKKKNSIINKANSESFYVVPLWFNVVVVVCQL